MAGTKRTIAGLALAAIAACAPPAGELPDPPTICGTPSHSCELPFPSERWLTADPDTPTGVRVHVPDGAIPPSLADQLGPGAGLADMLREADGFSPLTLTALQVPDPIAPDSIPEDGGDLVGVWDVETGERVPVRATVSSDVPDERGAYNVVLVWPVDTYRPGGRYVAALRAGPRTPTGRAVRPAPNPEPHTGPGRSADLSVVPWSDLLASTSFVVRSGDPLTADLERLAEMTRAEDHPIRGVTAYPSIVPDAISVAGQVLMSDFRDDVNVLDLAAAKPRPLWVDFMMTLPRRPASGRGAPVAIYGHGLATSKESQLLVAGRNAAAGVATVGVDLPSQGHRIDRFKPAQDMKHPGDVGRLISVVRQGTLDLVALEASVRHHFHTIDLLPGPDLDTTRVFYMGTSLGGYVGVPFLGLTPGIEGAFMHVTGTALVEMLFHSWSWAGDDGWSGIVPQGADTGRAHALVGLTQLLVDTVDGAHHLPTLFDSRLPVTIVHAKDDGMVTARVTERLLRGLDLAAVTSPAAIPADGRASLLIPLEELDGNPLKKYLAHVWFVLDPRTDGALDRWLTDRLGDTP